MALLGILCVVAYSLPLVRFVNCRFLGFLSVLSKLGTWFELAAVEKNPADLTPVMLVFLKETVSSDSTAFITGLRDATLFKNTTDLRVESVVVVPVLFYILVSCFFCFMGIDTQSSGNCNWESFCEPDVFTNSVICSVFEMNLSNREF